MNAKMGEIGRRMPSKKQILRTKSGQNHQGKDTNHNKRSGNLTI